MEVQSEWIGGVVVLVPTGPLDLSSCDPLARTLADLVARGEVRLVVDLIEVPLLDSAGLGALVQGMKQARAAGGDLRLCGVQPEIRSVLVLTGLTKRLRVYADRAEAVAFAER